MFLTKKKTRGSLTEMKKTIKLEIAKFVSSLTGEGRKEREFLERVGDSYRPFVVPDRIREKIALSFKLEPHSSKRGKTNVFFDSTHRLFQMETEEFNLQFATRFNKGEAHIFSSRPLQTLGTILRNIYTWNLLNKDGIVLHASGLIRGESAYVFAGPSESGKSTITKVSSHLAVINDDIVFLRGGKEGFLIYTTPPWNCGIKTLNTNTSFPLKALFILKKDKKDFLKKIERCEAFSQIITYPNLPFEMIPWGKLLTQTQKLIEKTPTYELHFLPQVSFWQCIKDELYY